MSAKFYSKCPVFLIIKYNLLQFSTESVEGRKNSSSTSPLPIKKPKSKNSGHIKSLLSQSEQNHMSSKQPHPVTVAIAKKAPTIKILNKKTNPTIPEIQPIPLITEQATIITDQCLPLIEMPEHIELSCQEVVVESTNLQLSNSLKNQQVETVDSTSTMLDEQIQYNQTPDDTNKPQIDSIKYLTESLDENVEESDMKSMIVYLNDINGCPL